MQRGCRVADFWIPRLFFSLVDVFLSLLSHLSLFVVIPLCDEVDYLMLSLDGANINALLRRILILKRDWK